MGDFLRELEARNSSCDCEDLQILYRLRKATETAQARYLTTYGNVNLDRPLPEDERFLRQGLKENEAFENAKQGYYRELQTRVKEGEVSLQAHAPDKRSVSSRVSLLDLTDFKEKGFLITANCSRCGTQIDVID
jgi:hypothetical protein